MTNDDTSQAGGGRKPTKPDVPAKKGRKRQWHRAFLEAFRQIGVVAPAAAMAGVSRHAVRMAAIRDPKFAKAYEDALEDSTERLEAVAFARASRAQSPSDLLLMFLLKARRPATYRDNYRLEHTGPDGAPVAPVVAAQGAVILLPQDGFEELAARYASGENHPTEPRASV